MPPPTHPRRSRWLKRGSLFMLATFLLIQLVPVQRTNPPVTADFEGPAEIKAIFEAKCYDCHSNASTWPWYAKVAPVSWWVVHHVEEGRAELNFSEWGSYSERRKTHKTEEIYDEIVDGYMPLKSYLIMHGDAKVTDAEKALIERWLDGDLPQSKGRAVSTN